MRPEDATSSVNEAAGCVMKAATGEAIGSGSAVECSPFESGSAVECSPFESSLAIAAAATSFAATNSKAPDAHRDATPPGSEETLPRIPLFDDMNSAVLPILSGSRATAEGDSVTQVAPKLSEFENRASVESQLAAIEAYRHQEPVPLLPPGVLSSSPESWTMMPASEMMPAVGSNDDCSSGSMEGRQAECDVEFWKKESLKAALEHQHNGRRQKMRGTNCSHGGLVGDQPQEEFKREESEISSLLGEEELGEWGDTPPVGAQAMEEQLRERSLDSLLSLIHSNPSAAEHAVFDMYQELSATVRHFMWVLQDTEYRLHDAAFENAALKDRLAERNNQLIVLLTATRAAKGSDSSPFPLPLGVSSLAGSSTVRDVSLSTVRPDELQWGRRTEEEKGGALNLGSGTYGCVVKVLMVVAPGKAYACKKPAVSLGGAHAI